MLVVEYISCLYSFAMCYLIKGRKGRKLKRAWKNHTALLGVPKIESGAFGPSGILWSVFESALRSHNTQRCQHQIMWHH